MVRSMKTHRWLFSRSFWIVVAVVVLGAALIFAVSFMVMAGIQILASRMLDARKTLTVGLALIAGLAVDMVPGMLDEAPVWAQSLLHSSLSTSTIAVVLLNLLFRIGIARRATLELDPQGSSSDDIVSFFERQGGLWAARRDVMDHAKAAVCQLVEAVREHQLATGPLKLEAAFDELRIAVELRYAGTPLALPTVRPSAEAMLESPAAGMDLAGFLVRSYADEVSADTDNGQALVTLAFDH